MDYKKTRLNQKIVINQIVSVHYFEYTSNFFFPGEAHDFWELLYVDKGEISVTADTNIFDLKQGEIIFHKPMEFHSLKTNGVIAPNLIVISFDCNSKDMGYFESAQFKLGNEERDLLSKVITEAVNAFSSPLDEPHLLYLTKKSMEDAFGSEQLIKIYLEELFIKMIRKDLKHESENKTTTSFQEQSQMDIINRTILYLEDNLQRNITLDTICCNVLVGRSHLQKLFHDKINCGVMRYFTKMKIEVAKQMIREGRKNFTEISEYLGYSSVSYFSRSFKIITGMSPSEYSTSVKSRIQTIHTDCSDAQ